MFELDREVYCMKKVLSVSIKTIIFFVGWAICVSVIPIPDTAKCGNLEILGRTDPAFVRYCDHTYFLAGRSEKDTITSDREACL